MSKVLSPEEALKEFMSKGDAQEVSGQTSFNPSMWLHNENNEQRYVQGVLLKRKEIPSAYGEGKKQAIYDIQVFRTNSIASKPVEGKKGEYLDVKVSEGDVVGLWATSKLDEQLKTVTAGNEVYVQYIGKATKAAKGRQKAHLFKVVQLPSRNQSVQGTNDVGDISVDEDDE